MSEVMHRDATISECGRYRYDLGRSWVDPGDDKADAYAVFIMLNPSTADDQQDDPTIRRCIDFAKQWGMGGLMVVNLFAWRATDPRELYSHPDEKIGPRNDEHISAACLGAQLVVAAWGNRGLLLDRGSQVRKMIDGLRVLKLTGLGQPAHPLYLRRDLKPVAWQELMRELADDVESEIHARYTSPPHPALANKYARDMEPVKRARAMVAAAPVRDEAWQKEAMRLADDYALKYRYAGNRSWSEIVYDADAARAALEAHLKGGK